jgi:hypothetical protein
MHSLESGEECHPKAAAVRLQLSRALSLPYLATSKPDKLSRLFVWNDVLYCRRCNRSGPVPSSDELDYEALEELAVWEIMSSWMTTGGGSKSRSHWLAERAGPMLRRILGHLEDAVEGGKDDSGGAKLMLYGGHDTTVLPLRAILGIAGAGVGFPTFTSSVTVELYREEHSSGSGGGGGGSEAFVRVLSDHKPVAPFGGACGALVPWTVFKTLADTVCGMSTATVLKATRPAARM